MTNEELAALIQAGERERIPELWAQVEKYVWKQANRRALSLEGYGGVTEEDLYQSGFLALLDAVESYDHAAGMSFIGWLNLRLKNSFAEAAGYRSKKRDVLDYAEDIDAPINDADGLSVADLLAAPDGLQSFEKAEDRLWREQLRAALERALEVIPEAQATVLRRRFFDGATLAEVAREAGVNIESARQRQNKGLRSIRRSRMCRELEQFIELRTPYWARVGVAAFNSSHTSAVELAVLRSEELLKKVETMGK